MSSGFVPAGSDASSTKPDDAWVKAQQLVAQSRSAEARPSKQDDGKTLYDVLQQNKAAKQEAFEEAAKLKNQFRSLDDDEIDFLDSVLESTRAKEAEVRKETSEQLEAFRKQREAAEKVRFEEDNGASLKVGEAGSPASQETWAARPKKRRRDREGVTTSGAKLRKMSSTETERPDPPTLQTVTIVEHPKSTSTQPTTNKGEPDVASTQEPDSPVPKQAHPPATTLGLGGYSSDED